MYERNRELLNYLGNILNFIMDYLKKVISNSIEDPTEKMQKAVIASENQSFQ